MTQYVQLRESDKNNDLFSEEYLNRHPILPEVAEKVAKTFMREWFPRTQPVGEDLEAWTEISYLDALIAIRCLVAMGLLSDIDDAKVNWNDD